MKPFFTEPEVVVVPLANSDVICTSSTSCGPGSGQHELTFSWF